MKLNFANRTEEVEHHPTSIWSDGKDKYSSVGLSWFKPPHLKDFFCEAFKMTVKVGYF
jgi:hypothetical protein